MKKISIITVCKNDKNRIEKTIESVINQDYENIEFIIIDGNSTDGTTEIIKKYLDKISIFVSEPDTGVYDAMNKGIKYSTGDYLFFLNAGDYFYDNNVLSRIFTRGYNEDLIYGNIFLYRRSKPFFIKLMPTRISNYFMLTDMISHQAIFFTRKVFDELGLYNEKYKISADYDIILKSFKKGFTYRKVKEIISIVEFEGINSKRENIRQRENERKQVQAEIYKLNLFQKFMVIFYILFIKYSRYFLGMLIRGIYAPK